MTTKARAHPTPSAVQSTTRIRQHTSPVHLSRLQKGRRSRNIGGAHCASTYTVPHLRTRRFLSSNTLVYPQISSPLLPSSHSILMRPCVPIHHIPLCRKEPSGLSSLEPYADVLANIRQARRGTLTGAVEEREPHDIRRTDPRDDLLDVLQPGLLLVRLKLWVARVGNKLLGKEDLAKRGAPVVGGPSEDGADGGGRARVDLGVPVGKSDSAAWRWKAVSSSTLPKQGRARTCQYRR